MTDQIMRTPIEWCALKSIRIVDQDGWRGHRSLGAKNWTEPITETEFGTRAIECTQDMSRRLRNLAP